jgi:hypothetical protein
MTGAGAIGALATWLVAGPARFWANWVLWLTFLISIGLGSLFLVALEHLVAARWSVPIRRVAERLSGLVLLAAPVALVALFALPVLYPWARPEAAHHPLIAAKAAWLNVPFFALRVIACLALWALSFRILAGGSIRQDTTKDPAFTLRARRFAPAFMALFALTITLVAFDWISSLEPEWYSDNLYNLGGFMFAWTVFWSYIGFAQYMLMWYGNMPEEVFWYKQRIQGPWLGVVALLAVVHFVLPFFALIPRESKGDPRRLRWVAFLMLGAHFLDLYWLIFPVLGETPLLSWPEISFGLLFIGAGLLWIRRAMAIGEDMPVGDPFLREGLEFRL